MLAALSVLGTCYLTTFGAGNKYCVFDASQNSKECYRRPDVDLPLTWFSTIVSEWEPLLNVVSVYSRAFSSHHSCRVSR